MFWLKFKSRKIYRNGKFVSVDLESTYHSKSKKLVPFYVIKPLLDTAMCRTVISNYIQRHLLTK
jgi:hypothetical protein